MKTLIKQIQTPIWRIQNSYNALIGLLSKRDAMQKIIKLSIEQVDFLKDNAKAIYDKENHAWYYIPFWFRDCGGDKEFAPFSIEKELPEELKEALEKNRESTSIHNPEKESISDYGDYSLTKPDELKSIIQGQVDNVQECKVIVKTLEILGTVSTYQENLWIDDKNHPEGGYHQSVTKYYSEPRVKANIILEVDFKINFGSIYTDGINNYRVISKNTLELNDGVVKEFTIPKQLIEVSRPFNEMLSSQPPKITTPYFQLLSNIGQIDPKVDE